MLIRAVFLSALLSLTACQSGDLEKVAGALLSEQSADPTRKEIGLGLKEALKVGARTAGDELSEKNGYLGRAAIKILFPSEFQRAEKALRKIGLGSLCDRAILSFNRAAENAAGKAFPILASAITQMTFTDALNILKGPEDAATQYLIRTSKKKLFSTFRPVIQKSANKTLATKYWGDIARNYNRIPFTKPIPKDINTYITNKALDGLFHMVRNEEKKIRENPVARTTDLLRRVFGFAERS